MRPVLLCLLLIGLPAITPASAVENSNVNFTQISLTTSADSTTQQNLFLERDRIRALIMRGSQPQFFAAPLGNDKPEALFDNPNILKNINTMESKNLRKAELTTQPWPDTYWPIYEGILGVRYTDVDAPRSSDWKENFQYVNGNPASNIFKLGNSNRINDLSPAEKYDLIIGDNEFNLTANQWSQGKGYYDLYGKVESWMGICHGWAPAAYMLPEPQNPVTVLAADGKTPVTFYPSDLKGLASYLWAQAPTDARFIGGRCNSKDPKIDSTGRVTDPQCFDTNPGTWHVAIVNKIGIEQRSFVMDANFDYEVWNQPVSGYRYSYFNPQTDKPTETFAEAKVAMTGFTNDKYKKYRNPKATQVVGISMEAAYITEMAPTHATLSPEESAQFIRRVTYVYDLELDNDGNILGGEWYSHNHPDFLWTPESDSKAMAPEDFSIPADSKWDTTLPLPVNWRTLAKQASKNGQVPLAHIVETLIEKSRK